MSKKSKCGQGEILRKGYRRKGYHRNEYVRSDGTVVGESDVPGAYVPPTCVPDMGRKGRGKKVLPPPGNEIHLSSYGYSIHKPESERHAALEAASNDYGTLKVLRRLNLLRNYQAIPDNKEIFSDDVVFMQDMYDPERKSKRRESTYDTWENEHDEERRQNLNNQRNRRKGKKQRGGQEDTGEPLGESSSESETSDIVVEQIGLPETTYTEINTIIDRQKYCDNNGICGVRNQIYEMHNVDGKEIVYYTLEEADVDNILALDKMYLDSDRTREAVLENLKNNPGLLIGIKINGTLQGYCQYEPIESMEVKIVWFCANKGSGTALYTFIEKYFKLNNYTKIILDVSLIGSFATRRINFWYQMGFTTYESIPEKNKVHMEKNI